MQTLDFHTVNVFTNTAFTGNPLAIVMQADTLSDQQMQTLAREYNLPETIFIQTPAEPTNTAKVRIFTPVNELPFAGHPTIGCAIFLAQQQREKTINPDQSRNNILEDYVIDIRLEEVAGLVPVKVECKQGHINAQFTAPVLPTPAGKIDQGSTITFNTATAAKALGISETDIGPEGHQPMPHVGGPTFLFVPLNNLAALSKAHVVEPLCTQLSSVYGATGLYVYYLDKGCNEIDARMFAPAAGIPEDPATGSATALLASQLHIDMQLEEGNNHFSLRQGYDMGRPSDLLLDIELVDSELTKVNVAGSSIPISSGSIRVPAA